MFYLKKKNGFICKKVKVQFVIGESYICLKDVYVKK